MHQEGPAKPMRAVMLGCCICVSPGACPHAWVDRKGMVLQSQQNTEEAVNQDLDAEGFIPWSPAKGSVLCKGEWVFWEKKKCHLRLF